MVLHTKLQGRVCKRANVTGQNKGRGAKLSGLCKAFKCKECHTSSAEMTVLVE